MSADALLEEVRELGGIAEHRGDRLHLEAPHPFPPELLESLRDAKWELLRLLAAPSPCSGCLAAARRRLFACCASCDVRRPS